jgi:hypothetical protein
VTGTADVALPGLDRISHHASAARSPSANAPENTSLDVAAEVLVMTGSPYGTEVYLRPPRSSPNSCGAYGSQSTRIEFVELSVALVQYGTVLR